MDRMKQHYSDREILNITFLACMYLKDAIMCRALRLEYDDVEERIVEIPVPGDEKPGGPNEEAALAPIKAMLEEQMAASANRA